MKDNYSKNMAKIVCIIIIHVNGRMKPNHL